MSGGPHQLVLDLGHRPALGLEDFIVTESNAAAVAIIDNWPIWSQSAVALIGPPQSGKSHLVQVWCLKTGAPCTTAATIDDKFVEAAVATGAAAIEDIDGAISSEQLIFHLLNLSRQTGLSILMTSRQPPGEISRIELPDLRSRLRALPIAIIAPPDEALLKVLLVKLFADRQLIVEPPAINYLSRHLERSWAAAAAVVARIDELALTTHRRVTRALVSEALQSLNQEKA